MLFYSYVNRQLELSFNMYATEIIAYKKYLVQESGNM